MKIIRYSILTIVLMLAQLNAITPEFVKTLRTIMRIAMRVCKRIFSPKRDTAEYAEEEDFYEEINGESETDKKKDEPLCDGCLDQEYADFLIETCPKNLRDTVKNIKKYKSTDVKTKKKHLMTSAILLVGPPGGGKSDCEGYRARNNAPFVFLQGASLGNEYQNSAEANLQRCIEKAQAMNKDFAVVILDELHGFSDIKKIHKQDTGLALGTSIDNALDNVNLFFIFTANSTDNLPDTLRSRVASHTITIGLPNQEEKEKSIKFRMADELKEGTINEQLIATIARECNDCSHRDLEFLSKRIRSLICDHHVELTPGVIQHAVQILKIDSPSEKQESESWEKRFYNDHPIAANPATYGLLLSAGSMILSGGQWLFSTGKVVCEKAGEHKDAIDKIAEAAALTAASGAIDSRRA